MAKIPDYRAVVKVADKRWEEVGAGWSKDDGNVSIQLKVAPIPQAGKVNFLLVPNGQEE